MAPVIALEQEGILASTPIHPPPGPDPAQDNPAAAGNPDTSPASASPASASPGASPSISANPATGAAEPSPAAPLAAAPADRLVAKQATAAAGNHPVLWTALVFAAVIGTLAFLWGSRPPIPDAPNGALVDARSEILAIERLLDALAFPPGKVDGVANAETEAAIRDYQRAAGLPIDGYATPALLEELRAVAGTD